MKAQAIWHCFHPRALTNLSLFLPEDSSILILGLETLIRQNRPFTSKDLYVCFMFSPEGKSDLALFSSEGPDKPAPLFT
jgi:hypothetical protein